LGGRERQEGNTEATSLSKGQSIELKAIIHTNTGEIASKHVVKMGRLWTYIRGLRCCVV
jgi:hypothetical protein